VDGDQKFTWAARPPLTRENSPCRERSNKQVCVNRLWSLNETKIFGVLLIGIALLPGAVLTQGTSCKVIQEEAARLACFDKSVSDAKPRAVRPPKADVAAGARPLTPDQATYRANLDHAFLDAGVKLTVEAISDPKGLSMLKGAKLPVLMIWNGYLDRPIIYQIQKKMDVIGDARKANFGTVIFWDTSHGLYSFDVAKPGETCSRDLCF
jgi:hypothetical protein